MSNGYKVFTSILGERILNSLDENQPPEQAGFRRGLSTLHHILTINEVIQRCEEYTQPLYLVFIDFEKAFDTVEHSSVWKAVYDQGVPGKIVRILHSIYTSANVEVRTSGGKVKIDVERGVKQGDTISPALFSGFVSFIKGGEDYWPDSIKGGGGGLLARKQKRASSPGSLEEMSKDAALCKIQAKPTEDQKIFVSKEELEAAKP